MKENVRFVGLGILVLLTAANFAWNGGPRQDSFRPLLEGETFRAELVTLVDRTAYVPAACEVALVIHPDCGQCRRMAAWHVSNGYADGPLWISLAPATRTEEYVARYDIPRSRVLLANDGDRELPGLGIAGVPTGILLRDGRVSELATGIPLEGPPFPQLTCSPAVPELAGEPD